MARPSVLQENFSGGFKRDFPRESMPGNAVYDMVDYIPQLGFALRKRGGWKHRSPDLSTLVVNAQEVDAGFYAPFTAGSQLVASTRVLTTNERRLVQVTSDTTGTNIGQIFASTGISDKPIFYRDRLVFLDGTNIPRSYNGTTVANLGATAPAAKFGTIYKDRLVLGRTVANTNRLLFSNAGDPTVFDTANSFIDTTNAHTGVASLRDAFLIFSTSNVERIRGAIPPPGTDMTLDGLFDVGCIDSRSIVVQAGEAIWADTKGVYRSDGATIEDITDTGGIKTYWRETLDPWGAAWAMSAGHFGGYYFLSVHDGQTFKTALGCKLDERVWFRISNLNAWQFWQATGTAQELYYGRVGSPRVGSVSSFFSPAAAIKADADGTSVLPSLETPFYRGSPGLRSSKLVYFSYDLRDAATDNPTLTVSYGKNPEDTTYTAISTTLAETSSYTRARLRLGFKSPGLSFKLAQTGASAETKVYGIEVDAHEREKSRLS